MTTKKQNRRDFINYWRDVTERVLWTFVQGYGAAWSIASLPGIIPTYDKLFLAVNWQTGVAAAVYSLIKNLGVGATNIGDNDSASLLTTDKVE